MQGQPDNIPHTVSPSHLPAGVSSNSSPTIGPSSICMRRWQDWARISLCVTINMVWLYFRLLSRRTPMTSAVVLESRLPVGYPLNCTPIPLCLENRGFNCMYTCALCTTIKVGTQADCPSTDFYSNLNI